MLGFGGLKRGGSAQQRHRRQDRPHFDQGFQFSQVVFGGGGGVLPPPGTVGGVCIHVGGLGVHVGGPGVHVGGPGVHVGGPGVHVGGPGVHVGGPGVHVGGPGVHVGVLGGHVFHVVVVLGVHGGGVSGGFGQGCSLQG